jgi:hypothetical protein
MAGILKGVLKKMGKDFWETIPDIPKQLSLTEELYIKVEEFRLALWKAIQNYKDSLEREGIDAESKLIDATAIYNGRVLKLVINDYLPHKRFLDSSYSEDLRYRWIRGIANAVNALRDTGVTVEFHKSVLCQIVMYIPIRRYWDVDNRVYKYVIDALRYARVVPGDAFDKMSILLTGGVDKVNPRTEIYVYEPSHILTDMVTL